MFTFPTSGIKHLLRNAAMFAEYIAAAVLHKYYLRASQTEEVRTTDATARLCFDMASMAAWCQHRHFSRGVVAVVFPEYVFVYMCVYIDWCSVCEWTLIPKTKLGHTSWTFLACLTNPKAKRCFEVIIALLNLPYNIAFRILFGASF